MKNKRIPKTLPKFAPGGTMNFDEFNSNPEQQVSGTQNIYNQNRAKSNMLGTNQKLTGNQYAQMGNAVTQGAIGAYQTSQTPGLSEYEKNQKYGNSIKAAETGVVSAINPIFGMIHAGVTAATAPLTAKATQTDEQGNLKNKNFAKADIIGQGFADPMAMIPTMISNKFSMKKYINSVEDNAKGKIAAQKAQEDAYAQQQTDYQNQQQSMINAAFARGYANQNQTGGNTYVQYAKYGGQMKYAMGGMNMQPNARIEKEENVVAPNGGFYQSNSGTHESGNDDALFVPNKSMIFSDRLKAPGSKKTFAQLNKINNTNKEDKILDSNKTSSMSKRTAELMKFVKNKNSETLFNEQEALKQAKVEAYAKKMGVTLPQTQETPQEFPMGGVKLPMYPYGGDLDANMLSYGGDDPRFYNYQGSKVVKPNLNALNKDKGVSSDIGLNNYNNLLTTRAQVRDSKVLPTTTLPKFEYVNDPSKGSYDEQFNAYKKVYLPGFKFGGKKLPKYEFGVLTPEEKFRKKQVMTAEQNQKNLAFNKMTGNTNPGYNTPQGSAFTPEMIQASSDAMVEDSYPESASTTPINQPKTYPIRKDKNGKLLFDTPTSTANNAGSKRDQELYDAELARMNASGGRDSNKFDWKNTLGQVGNFAAQNAGNIYNLSRYNKPEIENYERLKATYLDPTAAIRDANDQARRAEYNVRGASAGNAGTYLSNRVALATQNTINKDRIRQEYANTNAGIANSVGQYNNELARQEVIANAMNRARTRSGKGEAIGSLGSNIANQMMDNKKTNMDQETLQLMMKYYDTPEFKRMMKEYKGKK